MKFIVDGMPYTAGDCCFHEFSTDACRITGSYCSRFQENGDLQPDANLYECDCLKQTIVDKIERNVFTNA